MTEHVAGREYADESIEATTHDLGAGIIFYIRDSQQFMFFRRTMVNEETGGPLNYPGMVDVIGGRGEPGETGVETALREAAEELVDTDTGEPFTPDADRMKLHKDWTDDRGVHLHIFGYEFDTMPNLAMTEGAGIVLLTKDELAATELAFGQTEAARSYAESVDAA